MREELAAQLTQEQIAIMLPIRHELKGPHILPITIPVAADDPRRFIIHPETGETIEDDAFINDNLAATGLYYRDPMFPLGTYEDFNMDQRILEHLKGVLDHYALSGRDINDPKYQRLKKLLKNKDLCLKGRRLRNEQNYLSAHKASRNSIVGLQIAATLCKNRYFLHDGESPKWSLQISSSNANEDKKEIVNTLVQALEEDSNFKYYFVVAFSFNEKFRKIVKNFSIEDRILVKNELGRTLGYMRGAAGYINILDAGITVNEFTWDFATKQPMNHIHFIVQCHPKRLKIYRNESSSPEDDMEDICNRFSNDIEDMFARYLARSKSKRFLELFSADEVHSIVNIHTSMREANLDNFVHTAQYLTSINYRTAAIANIPNMDFESLYEYDRISSAKGIKYSGVFREIHTSIITAKKATRKIAKQLKENRRKTGSEGEELPVAERLDPEEADEVIKALNQPHTGKEYFYSDEDFDNLKKRNPMKAAEVLTGRQAIQTLYGDPRTATTNLYLDGAKPIDCLPNIYKYKSDSQKGFYETLQEAYKNYQEKVTKRRYCDMYVQAINLPIRDVHRTATQNYAIVPNDKQEELNSLINQVHNSSKRLTITFKTCNRTTNIYSNHPTINLLKFIETYMTGYSNQLDQHNLTKISKHLSFGRVDQEIILFNRLSETTTYYNISTSTIYEMTSMLTISRTINRVILEDNKQPALSSSLCQLEDYKIPTKRIADTACHYSTVNKELFDFTNKLLKKARNKWIYRSKSELKQQTINDANNLLKSLYNTINPETMKPNNNPYIALRNEIIFRYAAA
jgi:hypothetical protein